MEIDLNHNYVFSEGLGKGERAGWRYAEMEMEEDRRFMPWTFDYGVDEHDNICLAVTGCGSDKIVPVITLGTATSADGLSATVLSDEELFAKLHVGEYDFEVDDDECEYEDEQGKLSYEYPLSVWPDGQTVEGRQWILVSLKNIQIGRDGFFDPKTFMVGVEGTNLSTPVITVYPDYELPETTRFTPSNVFGIDIDFSIDDDEGSFDPSFHLFQWDNRNEVDVPYVLEVGDSDEGDLAPIRFTVPSGGELYLKIATRYTGDHNWDMQTDGPLISGNAFGGDIRIYGAVKYWSSNDFFCIVISAKEAGEIILENFGGGITVNGIWFRPSDVEEAQCLATEAWYREEIMVANNSWKPYYRGFVTGMSVTKFGEKATLICYPNEGEALDHWEFVNCTRPSDATINSETLTFTVTKSMYDEIEADDGTFKRVIVRPVFSQVPGADPTVDTEPLPEVANDADEATVNAVVNDVGFADEGVKEAIGGSAEEYTAFKTWAGSVKGTTGNAQAGEAAVVVSPHAAAAYLLGAERLFANAPTVEIGEVSVGDGESVGTTAMSIAVTVKDGESVVAVNAAKVKAMFEATGDLGDWNGAAKLTPEVTVEEGDGATMRFKVTPGDGTAPRAFLRIRK